MSNMKQMQRLNEHASLDVVTTLQNALGDIRAGLTAYSAGAPVGPPLRSAEAKILKLLFSEEEVHQYYSELGEQSRRRFG